MAHAIPRRPFGTSGDEVSILALGGAHIGKGDVDEAEGIQIIHEAIEGGVNFLDNAWEYNDGESERRMGKALAQGGYRDQVFLMTKDCAHDRKANHSMQKLEMSLKRLQTDHLDLWMLHEVVWERDPDMIFAPGGSAESMRKAKEQGKVRFVGFTGHKHPDIFKRMLSHGFPFDAVLMPINALDVHFRSFEKEIVPMCQEQGIAVLGMKSFADGSIFDAGANITPSEALRYAMSAPVTTVVSGMDSLTVLRQNLEIAQNFEPLTDAERQDILARTANAGKAGQFEMFKTTRKFDANEGRVAHNYPLLPAP
jgi:uncharacterized protein